MPEYERLYGFGVDFDKFYDATVALLSDLFSDSHYGSNERQFLGICQDIEKFINGEIFLEQGVIKIFAPQNIDNTYRLFCRLAAAYFLHCRWNAKLERCQPEKYNLEVADEFLYMVLTQWQNEEQWKQVDQDFFKLENFFQNLIRFSFRFVSPLTGTEYIWKGSAYSPYESKCRLEIKVLYATDYGEYLKFLLTKKGNHIGDFAKTTRKFWDDFIGLGRARDPYQIEASCTADLDLILICISLGLDENIFKTLIELRNRAHQGKPQANPDIPVIFGESQLNALKGLLRDSYFRLAEAKRKLNGDFRTLPRRMLLDANLYMLKRGLRPVIHLNGAEANEARALIGNGVTEEFFNQVYLTDADEKLILNPEDF